MNLLFLPLISNAQWYIQPSLLVPTGNYAYQLKPGVEFELGAKLGDIDNRYRFGAAFGYYSLSPTQDTFKTYTVGSSGSNSPIELYPGWEHVSSYEVFSTTLTNDFSLMKKSKFSPVIGLDFNFFVMSIGYQTYSPPVEDYSTTGDDYWALAVTPRIGMQYRTKNNHWLFQAFAARTMSFAGTVDNFTYWKYSITIIHYGEGSAENSNDNKSNNFFIKHEN